jgi:signal transduction histidine kinase
MMPELLNIFTSGVIDYKTHAAQRKMKALWMWLGFHLMFGSIWAYLVRDYYLVIAANILFVWILLILGHMGFKKYRKHYPFLDSIESGGQLIYLANYILIVDQTTYGLILLALSAGTLYTLGTLRGINYFSLICSFVPATAYLYEFTTEDSFALAVLFMGISVVIYIYSTNTLESKIQLQKDEVRRTSETLRAEIIRLNAQISTTLAIAGIEHEVRGFINRIRSYLILSDERLQDIRDLVEIENTADLLDSLRLGLSSLDESIESGRLTVDQCVKILNNLKEFYRTKRVLENRNLKEVVEQCLEFMQHKYTRILPKIDVEISQDIIVHANPTSLLQVFTNILANSVEALDNPYKENRIVVRAASKDYRKIEVSIEDNGMGISSEAEDNVGGLFFTTKEKGSGIGLSVAKELVADMGGSFNIERLTKGVRVRFDLPLPPINKRIDAQ